MSIFTIKNNKLEIEAENLVIPEFRVIYERDTTSNKSIAIKELGYIYHMSDFKSVYNNMDEDSRKIELKKDLFTEDWIPNEEVDKAIIKYKKLNETPAMRLYKAIRKAIAKIITYYENVDLTETNSKGTLVHKEKDLSYSIGNVGKMMESLDKIEDRIKKEQFKETKIRGQKDIDDYERPQVY